MNIVNEYKLERNDIYNAGTVASLTKRQLKKLGFHPLFIQNVTIGVYEAEINVIIHSYGGTAKSTITDESVTIEFQDVGPGIEDIDLALTKGYSTASKVAIQNGFGAGMGLPNIKSVSDEMVITSSEDGTYLKIVFFIKEDSYV